MRLAVGVLGLTVLHGCACGEPARAPDAALSDAARLDVGIDGSRADAFELDAGPDDSALVDVGSDSSCLPDLVFVKPRPLPIDWVWLIDNGSSMEPAILDFQRQLHSLHPSELGDHVILLSLQASGEVFIDGSRRFGVCAIPPVAGDDACGAGPGFFPVNVDVRGTQTLEQFLGTLGQTTGYTASDPRGGPPWRDLLRPDAVLSVVVMSDDGARLEADQFESYAGGVNPFDATRVLPPGVLDPSWGPLFDHYMFSGLYGWGAGSDTSVVCHYADGSTAVSSGATYSELVARTGGLRRRICDVDEWDAFYLAVAFTERRLDCALRLPPPLDGELVREQVNLLMGIEMPYTVPAVASAAACAAERGWYYGDAVDPTAVLCPASCEELQEPSMRVHVGHGCATRGR